VRIISGIWKGKRLLSPQSMDVRPTSDKVKEAVFNIIRTRIEGSRALDLFAGTGSLGLEILSRGGIKVVFVENNTHVLRVLKMNCGNLASSEQYEIIPKDSFDAIKMLSSRDEPFDVIFVDPPYKSDLQSKSLNALACANLLVRQGIVVVEHDAIDIQPDIVQDMVKISERKHGNTCVTLYKRG